MNSQRLSICLIGIRLNNISTRFNVSAMDSRNFLGMFRRNIAGINALQIYRDPFTELGSDSTITHQDSVC